MIVGFQRFTADGAVGVSGDAVAVFGFFLDSGSGGAGDFTLKHGTGTGDTAIFSFLGSGANAFQYQDLGGSGVVFPNGCFVDIGNNVDAVVVYYTKVGS